MAKSCATCATWGSGQCASLTHGTKSGYVYHRCRCDACTKLVRDQGRRWARSTQWVEHRRNYFRDYRQNRPEPLSIGAREQVQAWKARNPGAVQESRRRQLSKQRQIPSSASGNPWTAEDDLIVTRSDISLTEMAYILGRTYAAVGCRRTYLRKEQAV